MDGTRLQNWVSTVPDMELDQTSDGSETSRVVAEWGFEEFMRNMEVVEHKQQRMEQISGENDQTNNNDINSVSLLKQHELCQVEGPQPSNRNLSMPEEGGMMVNKGSTANIEPQPKRYAGEIAQSSEDENKGDTEDSYCHKSPKEKPFNVAEGIPVYRTNYDKDNSIQGGGNKETLPTHNKDIRQRNDSAFGLNKPQTATSACDSSHICTECGAVFAVGSKLRQHMREAHIDIIAFKCGLCDKSFSQKCYLESHMLLHIKTDRYSCKQCDKTFPTQIHLDDHSQVHSIVRDVVKAHLQEYNEGIAKLVYNVRQDHPYNKTVAQDTINYPPGRIEKADRENMQTRKQFKCYDQCGEMFSSRSDLRRHMQTRHFGIAKPQKLPDSAPKVSDKKKRKAGNKEGCSDTLDSSRKGSVKPTNDAEGEADFSASVKIEAETDTNSSERAETTDQENIQVRKQFKCYDQCGEVFSSRSSLRHHVQLVHMGVIKIEKQQVQPRNKKQVPKGNSKSSKCTICRKTFCSKSNLTKHLQSAHGIKTNMNKPKVKECAPTIRPCSVKKNKQCGICGKIFVNYSSMRRHVNSVHLGIKSFKCTICQKRFTTQPSLKYHMASHRSCSYCDMKFLTEEGLRKHMRLHGSVVEDYSDTIDSSRKSSVKTEELCEDNISTAEEINNAEGKADFQSSIKLDPDTETDPVLETENIAQENVQVRKQFKCYDQCGEVFSSSSDLRRHVQIVHLGIVKTEQQQVQLKIKSKGQKENTNSSKCPRCRKTFCSKGNLIRHLQSVHDIKSNINKLKGKELTNMRPSAVKNDKQCSNCGKIFVSKTSLRRHFNSVHLGIKSFKCTVCQKRFTQRRSLVYHMANHKSCSYCDMKYLTEEGLTKHMRLHGAVGEDCSDTIDCSREDSVKTEELCEDNISSPKQSNNAEVEADLLSSIKLETDTEAEPLVGTETIDQENVQVRKQFKCYDQCGEVFSSSSELRHHVQTVHMGIIKRGNQQVQPNNKSQVPKRNTDSSKCSRCRKTFCSKGNLTRHLQSAHGIKSNIKNPKDKEPVIKMRPSGAKKDKQCATCGKIFVHKTSLRCHVKIVHLGVMKAEKQQVQPNNESQVPKRSTKSSKCPRCRKTFCSKGNLTRHLQSVHGIKTKINKPKEKNLVTNLNHSAVGNDKKCTCGKIFTDKRSMRRHVNSVHLGIKAFKCPVCQKRFTAQRNLKHHMASHKSCPHCDMKFLTHGELSKHKRVHGAVVLLRRLEDEGYIKIHGNTDFRRIKIELDDDVEEKEHKKSIKADNEERRDDNNADDCDLGPDNEDNEEGKETSVNNGNSEESIEKTTTQNECDKDNGRIGSEDTAKVINQMEFKCYDQCGEKFTSRAELRSHVKTVHMGITVFKCGECSKSFSSQATLKRHVTVHRSEHTFCLKCDMTFDTHQELFDHEKTHAGKKQEKGKTKSGHNNDEDNQKDLIREDSHVNKDDDDAEEGEDQSDNEADDDLDEDYEEEEDTGSDDDSDDDSDEDYNPGSLADYIEDISDGSKKKTGQGNDKEQVVDESISKSKRKTCTICGNTYSNSGNLARHLETTHGIKREKQPIKEKKPKSEPKKKKKQVSKYFSNEERDAIRTAVAAFIDTNVRNTCLHCRNRYKTPATLRRHIMSVHLGLKPFSCKFCPKKFSGHPELERHMQTHIRKEMPCPVCNKIFFSLGGLIKHKKLHTVGKIYKCEVCGKSYSDKWWLNYHMRVHQDVKPHKCEHCKKTFAFRKNLRLHLETHSEERKYKCQLCDKAFKSQRGLHKHKESHLDPTTMKKFKCDVCDKSFVSSDRLKNHKVAHQEDRPFKCDKCDKTFKTSAALRYHGYAHTTEKPIQCRHCKKMFKAEDQRNKHERLTHRAKMVQCKVCKKTMREDSYKKYHIYVHKEMKPFKCSFKEFKCKRLFRDMAAFEKHLNEDHFKKDPFTATISVDEKQDQNWVTTRYEVTYHCRYCSQTCPNRLRLRDHCTTHSEFKPFHCTKCQIPFSSYIAFSRHMARHEKGPSMLCDLCSYKCYSITQLNKHKLRHSGKRAYECDICHKRFKREDAMRIHKNMHDPEKLLKCHTCGKSYHTKGNLREHMRIHEGVKNYHCHLCGKQFVYKGDFKKHQRTHTGERPHKCHYCDSRFLLGANMRKHMQLVHGKKRKVIDEDDED